VLVSVFRRWIGRDRILAVHSRQKLLERANELEISELASRQSPSRDCSQMGEVGVMARSPGDELQGSVLCLWYVKTIEPIKAADTVSLQRLESSTTQ
jgi:hypothetical protein